MGNRVVLEEQTRRRVALHHVGTREASPVRHAGRSTLLQQQEVRVHTDAARPQGRTSRLANAESRARDRGHSQGRSMIKPRIDNEDGDAGEGG